MESVLSLVAQKIVFALASEAVGSVSVSLGEKLQRDEANEAMARIRSEFEHLRAFTSTVNPEKYTTAVEPWLQRAKEIADKMEDVIDEYLQLLTVRSLRSRLPSITVLGYSSPWDSTSNWRLINGNLKKIASDLSHLNEMKMRYEINKLQTEVVGNSSHNVVARLILPENIIPDEDNVINKEEKKKLTGWLIDKGQTKLRVISINGMGGLGKTFMINAVYKSDGVDSYFDCKAWVTISKSYQMKHTLTIIYKNLLGEKAADHVDDTSQSDLNGLLEKVCEFVKEKRYLIILDDVWDTQAYYDVKSALPDDKKGSRIVITTRSPEVASLANEAYRIKLSKLNKNQAWELFCQSAFPQEEGNKCPDELKEIGDAILKKCEGLPLAIVSIAKLLSLKRQTKNEWHRFWVKLDWQFSNTESLKEVQHVVMNTSYDDLPSYLKNCFLFCSIFPDYKIKRRKLIRLWIAESFIQGRGAQTMEEVAEEYLNELIHRSMMHVVKKNSLGRVKRCRMHTLVRDLTLERARKENFSFVWKESESTQLGNGARRLSVHDYSSNSNLFQMDFSNTRSLFVFGGASSDLMSLLNKISGQAKFLRILELEGTDIDEIPNACMNLFNLHYLGLRYTNIKLLPNSIRRLRNLQTLDLRDTKIEKLPEGINQLKSMRHLLTINVKFEDSYILHLGSFRCAKAPKGIRKLASLQQLDIAIDEKSVGQLGNLTQLRVLRLSNVRESYYKKLNTSMSQLPTLRYLLMIAESQNDVLQLQGLENILRNLEKLHLQGRLLTPTILDGPDHHGRSLNVRFKEGAKASSRNMDKPKLGIATIVEIWRRKMFRGGQEHVTRVVADPVRYSELKSKVFACLEENLRELYLSWSGLQEDPLPELGKLRRLTVLNLHGAYNGALLCFKKDWFPELKDLQLLSLPNLQRIIFQSGSPAKLQELEMEGLLELAKIPQGIEHITSLRHMYLSKCNSNFIHEIKEDPRGLVAHIAGISYWRRVDGKWDVEELRRPDDKEQHASNPKEITAVKRTKRAATNVSKTQSLTHLLIFIGLVVSMVVVTLLVWK